MKQPFNYTGEPGTCLWCGRKSRVEHDTEWVSEGNLAGDLRAFCEEHGIEIDRRSFKHPEHGVIQVAGWGNTPAFRVRTGLIAVNAASGGRDRPATAGDPGTHELDGYFCTAGCAQAFGIRFAQLGRRLRVADR